MYSGVTKISTHVKCMKYNNKYTACMHVLLNAHVSKMKYRTVYVELYKHIRNVHMYKYINIIYCDRRSQLASVGLA